MAHLPRFDPADVATKTDLNELRTELRTELREGLAAVNGRLDRLFVTILVAMFGIVTAMIGVILSVD